MNDQNHNNDDLSRSLSRVLKSIENSGEKLHRQHASPSEVLRIFSEELAKELQQPKEEPNTALTKKEHDEVLSWRAARLIEAEGRK